MPLRIISSENGLFLKHRFSHKKINGISKKKFLNSNAHILLKDKTLRAFPLKSEVKQELPLQSALLTFSRNAINKTQKLN